MSDSPPWKQLGHAAGHTSYAADDEDDELIPADALSMAAENPQRATSGDWLIPVVRRADALSMAAENPQRVDAWSMAAENPQRATLRLDELDDDQLTEYDAMAEGLVARDLPLVARDLEAELAAGLAARPAAGKRDWRKRFQSLYTPHPAPVRCDKVSDAFKQSVFDYMIVIGSHGGNVDIGEGDIHREPMFRTGQNVIFPVRFGSSIGMACTTSSTLEFVGHIPMMSLGTSPDFTGAILESALNRASFTRCIRQYDVGETVPNLEIFTPGKYYGDDDVFLYRHKTREVISLRRHLKCILKPVSIKLVSIPSSKKKKPKKKSPVPPGPVPPGPVPPSPVIKTIKKQRRKMNAHPCFKTRDEYKQTVNQPDDAPLTLADLCDAEHGLFEALFTKLKKEGLMAGDVKVSDVPVVVLACRAGHVFRDASGKRKSSAADSPVESNYETDVTMSSSSDSTPIVSKGAVADGGSRNATKKRRNRRNATKKRRNRRNATKKRRK